MSNLANQGGATGSGTVTVLAPNTSTNRTLTLPDATGTIATVAQVNASLPKAGGTMTGNLLLGSTPSNSAAGTLVEGVGRVGFSRGSGTGAFNHITFQNGNNFVGTVSTNGSTTTYSTSSDHRLKTDVQQMTGATQTFAQLKPCNFKWIADGTRADGFLAHELAAVIPIAVIGEHNSVDEDGKAIMQGIDQSKIIPLLVATVQELIARIVILENN